MSGLFDLPAVAPFEREDEIALPAGATSLDYLQSIYRDPRQPESKRLRAAIAALPFEHPKLAVTAVVSSEGFAAKLEAARARSAQAVIFRTTELLEQPGPGANHTSAALRSPES
ncbi:hypothetical protein [uncultured Bradyrhizobium sp.]|jgi:hypothetical protein|uniref:hypothetical protein n=1 Tax=uncultured Bradyrhizobium sp. TaxID=199684 RepID=UPI00260522EF|nr:hypothetical protein [uncultured Bradyrhizobium sp.]